MDNNTFDTIVIGGGTSGSLSAINIEKKNKVLLLEKGNELFPSCSSTHGSCYRIHTGFHYIRDLETSKTCLYKAIKFIKEFPSFYINDNINSHFHKSKFYLMSNSVISLNETLININSLKQYYKELINEDQTNQVLGYPEHLYEIIPKPNYISDNIPFTNKNGDLEYINVILCFTYKELILDYDKYKSYIINKVLVSNNIKVKCNDYINNIECINSNKYQVTSKNGNTYFSKSIINCSFESIEYLDKTIFKLNDSDLWTRLKISIVVQIPDSMKDWFSNTLFAIGPFCSFCVLPNNKMIIISEKYYNLGYFKSNQPVPDDIEDIIKKLNLNNEYGMNLVRLGLEDVCQYFNEPYKSDILNTKVYEIKRGFVKIYENNFQSKSMYNQNSGVHKRLEELHFRSNNYISNCSTKMTYGVDDSFKSAIYINKFLN
ncbi:hypothetical protein ACTFIY_000160 [Dictyostelium cf. discoideum]